MAKKDDIKFDGKSKELLKRLDKIGQEIKGKTVPAKPKMPYDYFQRRPSTQEKYRSDESENRYTPRSEYNDSEDDNSQNYNNNENQFNDRQNDRFDNNRNKRSDSIKKDPKQEAKPNQNASTPTSSTMKNDAAKNAADNSAKMAERTTEKALQGAAKEGAATAAKSGAANAAAGAGASASAGTGAASAIGAFFASPAGWITIIIIIVVILVACLFSVQKEKVDELVFTLGEIIKKETTDKEGNVKPSILYTNKDVKKIYKEFLKTLRKNYNDKELSALQEKEMQALGMLEENGELKDEAAQEIESYKAKIELLYQFEVQVPLHEEEKNIFQIWFKKLTSTENLLWWYGEYQPVLHKYLKAERYNHNKVKWYRYYRGDYADTAGYSGGDGDRAEGSGLLVLNNGKLANEFDIAKESKDQRDKQIIKGGLEQDDGIFLDGTFLTYPKDDKIATTKEDKLTTFSMMTVPYMQFWGIPYAVHIVTENYNFTNEVMENAYSRVEMNQYVLQTKRVTTYSHGSCGSGTSVHVNVEHENEYRMVKASTYDKFYAAKYYVRKYTLPEVDETDTDTHYYTNDEGEELSCTYSIRIQIYRDKLEVEQALEERKLEWKDVKDEYTEEELQTIEQNFFHKTPEQVESEKDENSPPMNRVMYMTYKTSLYKNYLRDPSKEYTEEELDKLKYTEVPYSDINLQFAFDFIEELMIERERLYGSMLPGQGEGGSIGSGAIDPNMQNQWPVPASRVITAKFGIAGYAGHTGLDIGAISNTDYWANPNKYKIVATADGTVEKIVSHYPNIKNPAWGYANYILIDHGNGVKTRYAHLSAIESNIKVGVTVKAGEIIATMGTSGNSTGPHLHFEVILNGVYVDPEPFLARKAENVPNGTISLKDGITVDKLPADLKSMHNNFMSYSGYITKYTNEYGFPAKYIVAMIAEESGFNTNAQNKDAKGLLQLDSSFYTGNLLDPENNLKQGIKAYSEAYKQSGNNAYEAIGRAGLGAGNWSDCKQMAGVTGNVNGPDEAIRVAKLFRNETRDFMEKMINMLNKYEQYYNM